MASNLPSQGGSITAQLPQYEVQQILQTGPRDQAKWYTKGNAHGLQIAVLPTAPRLCQAGGTQVVTSQQTAASQQEAGTGGEVQHLNPSQQICSMLSAL